MAMPMTEIKSHHDTKGTLDGCPLYMSLGAYMFCGTCGRLSYDEKREAPHGWNQFPRVPPPAFGAESTTMCDKPPRMSFPARIFFYILFCYDLIAYT